MAQLMRISKRTHEFVSEIRRSLAEQELERFGEASNLNQIYDASFDEIVQTGLKMAVALFNAERKARRLPTAATASPISIEEHDRLRKAYRDSISASGAVESDEPPVE